PREYLTNCPILSNLQTVSWTAPAAFLAVLLAPGAFAAKDFVFFPMDASYNHPAGENSDSGESDFVSDYKQTPRSEAPSGREAETIAPPSQARVSQGGSTESESSRSAPHLPAIQGYEILGEPGRGAPE